MNGGAAPLFAAAHKPGANGAACARTLRLAALVLACALLGALHALQAPPRAARALPAPPAPPFARHAVLLIGEIRTLREGLSSQLALFAASEGGVDVFAVLSPTTKHSTRPGVGPNATADAEQVAWLRALPSLRALRLVAADHHVAFIDRELPGFPWDDSTDYEWVYFMPTNVVAAFLKRRLAWQLMEETLAAAGMAAHRYDTVVVTRGDIVARAAQGRWPQGLDLGDFSMAGSMRGLEGRTIVPGQPDSWAPEESAESAQTHVPTVFVNSFIPEGPSVKVSDMFAVGDWAAMSFYCHAVDFMKRLCSEEKGGPEGESPVRRVNPGVLLAAGTIAGAREATRRARELDAAAPARGIRFSQLRVEFCLGQEGGEFSLENKLAGCFDV